MTVAPNTAEAEAELLPLNRHTCRVLALVTDGLGESGGIARFNADLVEALAASRRVREVALVPRFGRSDVAMPAKVQQIAPRSSRMLWAIQSIRSAIEDRPEVVFCGHVHAVVPAAGLARLRGSRLWVHVHGIEGWTPRGTVAGRCLEQAHLVTTASRYTRRRLLEWSRLAPEQVRVLPNTVRQEFKPRPRPADLVRRYGLEGRRVILTVGRLSSAERYKGHDRIIAALSDVARQCVPLAYLIVGVGDDRPRLAALAQRMGVGPLVVFAGHVGETELPDHYALGDVYAMPSTGEGFGIVFLEAAASGLPVIGGNRDGSVDALADGRIGRPIDPESPGELRSALVAALARTEAIPGRERESVARFRPENFTRHVDDLLHELLSA